MNILICSEHHLTQVGDKVYCHLLQPSLFQRYRDVWDEVVILARLRQADEPPIKTAPLDLQGVRVAGLPDYIGLAQFWRERRKIRAIARDALAAADSIILLAPGLVSTTAWLQFRRSSRPYGIELLGDHSDAFARGAIRHPLRPLVRFIGKRQLQAQCHGAYASNYVTTQQLQRRYPPNPKRFSTSYSDIELPADYIVHEPRKVFGVSGLYRLVMVGTLSQMYKGHDVLLHALADLHRCGLRFEMVLVGDGRHRQEMESLARTLGIDQQVRFLGEISAGQAVREQLDAADLFVLPSRTEGLPRALIEAMSRALPCVATSVGGIPELLDSGDLVPPGDVPALANKLSQVLSDPPRMAQMSQRNLAVAANYSKEVLQARRLEFFRHLRQGTEVWLRQQRREETGKQP